jgi:hypothetical protein
MRKFGDRECAYGSLSSTRLVFLARLSFLPLCLGFLRSSIFYTSSSSCFAPHKLSRSLILIDSCGKFLMKLSLSLPLTLSHESSLAGERAHTRCRIRNRARDCEQEKERERDEEIFKATLKHKQHLLLAASHQCRLSTGMEMVK